MFVAKGNLFLPSLSLKVLEEKYSSESDAKAKIRLQIAVLRKKGKSMPFIAEVTGKRESTISDILRRFKTKGITGCYAVKQNGQPPKLSNMERLKLRKALNKSPLKLGLPFVIWTTKLVAYYVKRTFKKDFVNRQIRRILKSFNMSIQKQRPEHIRANKKLQAEFKKKLDEELTNLCKQDIRSPFWMKASSP